MLSLLTLATCPLPHRPLHRLRFTPLNKELAVVHCFLHSLLAAYPSPVEFSSSVSPPAQTSAQTEKKGRSSIFQFSAVLGRVSSSQNLRFKRRNSHELNIKITTQAFFAIVKKPQFRLGAGYC